MSIDEKLVQQFMSLYKARTDAWGSIKGMSIKEPVTEANYRAHLEAKTSLGCYMLLDSGECHFAAIDLDEKVFDKALAIKKELASMGIYAYISASRSKGYHVTVYAETKFVAKDIRRVLAGVLNKLQIKINRPQGDPAMPEIFPKQDVLDKKVLMYGNYINIPCFGAERPWLTDDMKELRLQEALSKIKRTPEAAILAAVKALPPDPAKTTAAPLKRGPKPKHPPCVLQILQGVNQGVRDDAAFALARHYLDLQYSEDEVMAALRIWDAKNKPPFNDDRQLETKLKSAMKGYAFGCTSVKSGTLSTYCPGEEKCVWLQESQRDKKKKGFLKDTTFMETPDMLFEELVKGTESIFLGYHKTTGVVTKHSSIDIGETTWVPVMDSSITEGALILPNGVEEYDDTLKLVEDIRAHIHKYVDMAETRGEAKSNSKEEFAAWYVIMTWVADRLRTVGYYRFAGDTGTGKSRALDVVGRLCYKPMMLSGAVTPAPIYRLIRRFRGTLVMDEADFSDSSEKGEVVTILNCGFEKGRPIIRCSKDDPNTLEILPCFGPKVFATRFTFDDVALEARCISVKMEETERDDILSILDDTFFNEEMKIRNKLLLWRFRHYNKIEYNTIRDIDLGKLEPRMKQTSLPYALMFKDMPEVLERFRVFIHRYQTEIIETRAEGEQGRIIYAVFTLMAEHGKQYVSSGMITTYVNETFKMDITAQKVGKILNSLNIVRTKRRYQGKQQHYIDWNLATMRKIHRRYMVDKSDFKELFAGDPKFSSEQEPEPNEKQDDLDLDVEV